MAVSVPFSRGVNFSKWFETRSLQDIVFTKFIEQDFANVKSLGADVIRVPVAFHNYTLSKNDYTLIGFTLSSITILFTRLIRQI